MGGVDIVSLAYSVTVTAGGLMGYVRAGNIDFVFGFFFLYLWFVARVLCCVNHAIETKLLQPSLLLTMDS